MTKQAIDSIIFGIFLFVVIMLISPIVVLALIVGTPILIFEHMRKRSKGNNAIEEEHDAMEDMHRRIELYIRRHRFNDDLEHKRKERQ